ncbi:MAG: cytochrome c oxidase subunit II [Gammaproteobacteria bacterium]|jgi:cytochrome c oxidase subunit 2|nr:cytochrome c oxidase subunit II [Gammaproteobacteria bacterium]
MAFVIVTTIIVIGTVLWNFITPWWFTPLASNWGSLDQTIIISLWVTGVAFVLVSGFILYCVVKFRYKEGHKSEYEPENTKLEVILTVITTIGVIILLAPGLIAWNDYVNLPEDAIEVEGVGQQWVWTYRFPGEDGVYGNTNGRLFSSKNTFGLDPSDPNSQDDILIRSNHLHLPIDEPVVFQLRSKDVLHDFYIPQFRAKMDLVPGQQTNLWFTPTILGTYEVACAEYCGTGHFAMRGLITVDTMNDFQSWLAEQPTFFDTMNEGTQGQGKQIVQTLGCVACHSDNGNNGIGPTWKNSFGAQRVLANGETIIVDAEYIKESIVNPNAKTAQGYAPVMPAYKMSDDELDAIVEYIETLSE